MHLAGVAMDTGPPQSVCLPLSLSLSVSISSSHTYERASEGSQKSGDVSFAEIPGEEEKKKNIVLLWKAQHQAAAARRESYLTHRDCADPDLLLI